MEISFLAGLFWFSFAKRGKRVPLDWAGIVMMWNIFGLVMRSLEIYDYSE